MPYGVVCNALVLLALRRWKAVVAMYVGIQVMSHHIDHSADDHADGHQGRMRVL